MRVTNVSDSALHVLTGRGAHLTSVKDGLVVARRPGMRSAGIVFDLGPGASRDYKSTVNLRRCNPAPPAAPVPLASGTYQLYASQRFTLGRERSTRIIVQGGPWNLVIARTDLG